MAYNLGLLAKKGLQWASGQVSLYKLRHSRLNQFKSQQGKSGRFQPGLPCFFMEFQCRD